jgi:outer membrane receptor protein involved in Fe transport
LILILVTTATPAFAEADQQQSEIVVVGTRFREVVPVRSLTGEAVSSYGVSTLEDLILEIRGELGDDEEEPVFILNGERVNDLDEIAGYPVEALQRLDVLPRGSGIRVGASPTRRVYNLVLKKQVRSATLAVAPRFATDGGAAGGRGEVIATRIKGQDRLNLTLRVREEGALFESERGIIQPEQRLPFDIRGNVISDPRRSGNEIDPRLSALAGSLVTIAAVPPGLKPTLSDFAARANAANFIDLGRFRTLRPDSRTLDLNLSHGTRLAPWLTSSANVRLSHSKSRSLRGLASGLFILAPENPFSPFSDPVGIARFAEAGALGQRFRSRGGDINLSLNAAVGNSWRVNLAGSHEERSSRSFTDRQPGGTFNPILLDTARNPFMDDLADLLPIVISRSASRTRRSNIRATANGSLVRLPAGPAQVTAETRVTYSRLASQGDEDVQIFSRNERLLRGSAEFPIASRANGFLPGLGELTANFDYAQTKVSDSDPATELSYGFTWSPVSAIRIQGFFSEVRRPPAIELLGEPVTTAPGVRVFDILSGQTVDATFISGGNPALVPERVETDRLSLNLRPLRSTNLQLSAEYTRTEGNNFATVLPIESARIALAFPDRFARNADGLLSIVDLRPINFAAKSQDRLRYGFNIALPLGRAAVPARNADRSAASTGELAVSSAEGEAEAVPLQSRVPPGGRLRLDASANHTWVFRDEVLIRPSTPPIDLLSGGAIGIAGGRPRHQLDFSLGLSSRGTGVRLTGIWRSESLLEVRAGSSLDSLRFSPLGTMNLRGFAEGSRLFPQVAWLKQTRFSLSVTNLLNERQRVSDTIGNTPLRYQPGYRDPTGRTIEIELRKVL